MDSKAPRPNRAIIILTLLIQAALAIGFITFVVRQDWEKALLTLLVVGLITVPAFVLRRHRVYVPPEFQLIAVAFVFLSLFMGSVADFYERFWWWDIVLHISSGVLLGVVGWITLFLLNRTNRLPPGIHPAFLCFFGLTFAVSLGVLWEIYEFAVDQVLGENMQRRETGVADTMQDLIINMGGATVVAVLGWLYFRTGRYPFLVGGLRTFMSRNPRLFRRKRAPR
jgi:hypothetical protein